MRGSRSRIRLRGQHKGAAPELLTATERDVMISYSGVGGALPGVVPLALTAWEVVSAMTGQGRSLS